MMEKNESESEVCLKWECGFFCTLHVDRTGFIRPRVNRTIRACHLWLDHRLCNLCHVWIGPSTQGLWLAREAVSKIRVLHCTKVVWKESRFLLWKLVSFFCLNRKKLISKHSDRICTHFKWDILKCLFIVSFVSEKASRKSYNVSAHTHSVATAAVSGAVL